MNNSSGNLIHFNPGSQKAITGNLLRRNVEGRIIEIDLIRLINTHDDNCVRRIGSPVAKKLGMNENYYGDTLI